MYEAVMLRDRRSLRRGFYIKKFGSLEEFAEYIMSPNNLERYYRARGLTCKERRILTTKCWSIVREIDK